jgi:hypothetical protein
LTRACSLPCSADGIAITPGRRLRRWSGLSRGRRARQCCRRPFISWDRGAGQASRCSSGAGRLCRHSISRPRSLAYSH